MTQADDLDSIERSIEIAASAATVWSLVQRPGWWINEESVDPEPPLRDLGDGSFLLQHAKFGDFRIAILESRAPHYVAYRCTDVDASGTDGDSTEIRFWIREVSDTEVVLRVSESGLAAIRSNAEDLAELHRDNTQGWDFELSAASRFLLEESPRR